MARPGSFFRERGLPRRFTAGSDHTGPLARRCVRTAKAAVPDRTQVKAPQGQLGMKWTITRQVPTGEEKARLTCLVTPYFAHHSCCELRHEDPSCRFKGANGTICARVRIHSRYVETTPCRYSR